MLRQVQKKPADTRRFGLDGALHISPSVGASPVWLSLGQRAVVYGQGLVAVAPAAMFRRTRRPCRGRGIRCPSNACRFRWPGSSEARIYSPPFSTWPRPFDGSVPWTELAIAGTGRLPPSAYRARDSAWRRWDRSWRPCCPSQWRSPCPMHIAGRVQDMPFAETPQGDVAQHGGSRVRPRPAGDTPVPGSATTRRPSRRRTRRSIAPGARRRRR